MSANKTKYDLSVGILVTIVIIVFLLVLLLFPLPGKSDTVDQQVVLQVVSNGGEKLVVPKAIVILRLIPLSGPTVNTPLGRGDLMVCRTYDSQDENHVQHTGFRCGSDTYVIAGLRYQESK